MLQYLGFGVYKVEGSGLGFRVNRNTLIFIWPEPVTLSTTVTLNRKL